MSSMDTISSVLSEAGLRLDSDKATEQMKNSVFQFALNLVCPLCNKIYDRPTTLSSCEHSFCMDCIDEYCSNAETCPVKGCNMPLMSLNATYRKINPQLSQSIESLTMIVNSLNRSNNHWWLSGKTLKSIDEMKLLRTKETLGNCNNGYTTEDEQEVVNNDSEEMIDLQQGDSEQ